MTRAFDFVVVGVIVVISAVIHLIGVTLFGPESALHGVAASATHFNAGEKADTWYAILAVWMPLLASAGIIAWAFFREYRRQTATVLRGAP